MNKGRLEAFTDGVIAVVITVMVLELKVPAQATWVSLLTGWPIFLSYVLSFIYVGIYWNNHHHMLQIVERIDGTVMWCNLFFLFCLSLFPFTTAWLAEAHPRPASVPTILYGLVLLLTALAWALLSRRLIAVNGGRDSALRHAFGRDGKGIVSIAAHVLAIGSALFYPIVSCVLYALVAAAWFLPDPRIELRMREA